MYLQQNHISQIVLNENIHKTSSIGHSLTECSYLDSHYNAARPQYNKMIRSVGFQKGWSVLDAGSGSGCFIPILSEILGNYGKIYAIDLTPENVNFSRKRFNKSDLSCRVFHDVGNITSMQYSNNSFDAIWCSNVFQYLTESEKEQTLNEFYRIVRPDGLIAIKELDLSASHVCPDPTVFKNILKKMKFSTQVHSTLRTYELPMIAFQTGLEVISRKTFFVEWFPPLQSSELPYLNAISQSFGFTALEFDLSEKESSVINRYIDPYSEDYFINSKDFYWKEAYSIVICKVPMNKD
jgi:arsenite methyltransferase